MNIQREELIKKAIDSRRFAYVRYSHFSVGAALLAKSGKVYVGCNIENSSYGATNCAERTAFFSAIAQGEKEFEAIVIVGGPEGKKPEKLCFPCGICRQVMREFCNIETFKVIVAKSPNEYREHFLKELIPESFGPENLD